MEHHLFMYRNRYRTLVPLCIGLLLSGTARAQTLNLYEAVERTINNYPLIQQRQAEAAASRAHVKTINNYKLPSLTLHDQVDAGTANSLAGSYFPLGLIPSTSGGITEANNSTMATGNIAISQLEWNFYNFGYYRAQKQEAEAQAATAESYLNREKYNLTESVVSLYLDFIKKYQLLQIAKDDVDRNATILNVIRASVLSGLKPGVDSATASAAYAHARIGYLQALDAYRYDQIALGTYTTLDSIKVQPDTTILSPTFRQRLAAFVPADSVGAGQPLLDVYQKEYAQQISANKTISRRYLPKFSLEGAAWMRGSSISPSDGYSNNLGDGLSYSRYNYLAGLTLTYNLVDLKHRHDLLVEGNYEAKARQQAVQNEQLALDQLLQQANSAYSMTVGKLNELPIQLYSARNAYQQQMALYRAGLNTLIDVTNAVYALNQAETSYALAQNDLIQLLYIRAGLSNQLDTFLQNFKQ